MRSVGPGVRLPWAVRLISPPPALSSVRWDNNGTKLIGLLGVLMGILTSVCLAQRFHNHHPSVIWLSPWWGVTALSHTPATARKRSPLDGWI